MVVRQSHTVQSGSLTQLAPYTVAVVSDSMRSLSGEWKGLTARLGLHQGVGGIKGKERRVLIA